MFAPWIPTNAARTGRCLSNPILAPSGRRADDWLNCSVSVIRSSYLRGCGGLMLHPRRLSRRRHDFPAPSGNCIVRLVLTDICSKPGRIAPYLLVKLGPFHAGNRPFGRHGQVPQFPRNFLGLPFAHLSANPIFVLSNVISTTRTQSDAPISTITTWSTHTEHTDTKNALENSSRRLPPRFGNLAPADCRSGRSPIQTPSCCPTPNAAIPREGS